MNVPKRSACFLLLLLLFNNIGCAGRSAVQETWLDPSFEGEPFKKILVFGVVEKITTRNLFEGLFTDQLKKMGIAAIPSYEILPYNNILSRDAAVAAIQEFGFDSVLFISFQALSVETTLETEEYVSMDTFYNNLFRSIHRPEMKATGNNNLKCNFYDVDSEKMIWTFISKSKYSHSMKSLHSAAALIISKLRSVHLI